jgi:hypothetical protein
MCSPSPCNVSASNVSSHATRILDPISLWCSIDGGTTMMINSQSLYNQTRRISPICNQSSATPPMGLAGNGRGEGTTRCIRRLIRVVSTLPQANCQPTLMSFQRMSVVAVSALTIPSTSSPCKGVESRLDFVSIRNRANSAGHYARVKLCVPRTK